MGYNFIGCYELITLISGLGISCAMVVAAQHSAHIEIDIINIAHMNFLNIKLEYLYPLKAYSLFVEVLKSYFLNTSYPQSI